MTAASGAERLEAAFMQERKWPPRSVFDSLSPSATTNVEIIREAQSPRYEMDSITPSE